MRFVTFRHETAARVGVLREDRVIETAVLVPDAPPDLVGIIGSWPLLKDRFDTALRSSAPDAGRPIANVDLLPPIPRPGKVVCLGLNYIDHAAEGGNQVPDYPALFLRTTTSLTGPAGPMIRPHASEKLDYEVELMVVIGARTREAPEDRALEQVFGYTVFNDGSVRDYQRKTSQWTPGKNFDSTGPMGPAVVTADELPEGAHGLGIRSRLNGEVMQDGNTADMVFPVARTISLLSEVMTLEPGDVLAMGTPAGVGHARRPQVWLRPGDLLESEIDEIGTLRTRVAEPSSVEKAAAGSAA